MAAEDKLGRQIQPVVITDGRKVVTTAGTRVQLETTSRLVNFIIITAETNNTGNITVGASTVVAALTTRRGTPLNAGDSVSLGGVDLAEVYIDSTVSSDGVTYLDLT